MKQEKDNNTPTSKQGEQEVPTLKQWMKKKGIDKQIEMLTICEKLLEENEKLEKQIEGMKHNKETAMLLALEYGYKQCEKGENIQAAFINYNSLTRK